MNPVAHADGHDGPWLVDDAAPGGAGVIRTASIAITLDATHSGQMIETSTVARASRRREQAP